MPGAVVVVLPWSVVLALLLLYRASRVLRCWLPSKDTNSRVDGSFAIVRFVLQLLNAKPENVELCCSC